MTGKGKCLLMVPRMVTDCMMRIHLVQIQLVRGLEKTLQYLLSSYLFN